MHSAEGWHVAVCRYPARLYGSLGVDLWMLKLHSRLAVLAGTARTFTGHVRTWLGGVVALPWEWMSAPRAGF